MRKTIKIFAVGAAVLLAGCAMRPLGPTVRVMPAPYKPFEVFQQDHYDCEQFADLPDGGRCGTCEQSRSRCSGYRNRAWSCRGCGNR